MTRLERPYKIIRSNCPPINRLPKNQMKGVTFVKGNYQESDKAHVLQEADLSLDTKGCCLVLARPVCVANVDGQDLFLSGLSHMDRGSCRHSLNFYKESQSLLTLHALFFWCSYDLDSFSVPVCSFKLHQSVSLNIGKILRTQSYISHNTENVDPHLSFFFLSFFFWEWGVTGIVYFRSGRLFSPKCSYLCPYWREFFHWAVAADGEKMVKSFELEGAFKGHLVQLPCTKQERLQLSQVAQSPVQTDLEYLQGWGIHHFSGENHWESLLLFTIYKRSERVRQSPHLLPASCWVDKWHARFLTTAPSTRFL